MAQFSEQDLILLNSYLDGRLDTAERAALETRLAQEGTLRDELETLRATIGLLKMAERVPAPRSFTLDPAVYGKPVRRSLWDRIGLGAMPGWAVATASLAVVLLCIGALIAGGGLGSPTSGVANNAAAPQAGAAVVAEATEAPTEAPTELSFAAEAATEAPAATEAAALAPAPTEAATEAPPTFAALAAQSPTEPSGKFAPVAPPAAVLLTPSGGGGVGGGPAANGSAPQPAAQTIVPAQPSQASSGGAQDSASRAMTSNATPAPYSTIEITEAAPWDNLKGGSWAVLVAGTVVLIGLVLGATLLMRRRR